MIKRLTGQEIFIIATAVLALLFMYSTVLMSGDSPDLQTIDPENEMVAAEEDFFHNELEFEEDQMIIKTEQLNLLTKENEHTYAYAYEKADDEK
ncbi:hypothetical protein [Bacillus sp. FJAT-45037]|uniref:hypothetical protein n=1 Tax=Bacillus sp. FJAT-45037 TaxID=2011007 RepID=UPI000C24B52C|nr:hypothetical protein [Bacillus sp. FJAT-45037]